MKYSRGTFEGASNVELFYQSWLPEQNARAVIVILHGGNGDHSDRYKNVVDHFVACNYAIYAFDQRGNGQSPGHRGHINHWNEFREDLAKFLELAHREQPNLPLFLFSHSLGGVIALDFSIRNPHDINGIICSAPAIGHINVAPILWTIARILDRIWPTLSIATGLDLSKISRDVDVVQTTKDDPLVHGKATPRLAMQLNETVDWVHTHANELSIPLLVLHGTEDELASIEGSRRFFHNVQYEDSEMKEYDGGYHELFNDTIKEEVFIDIEQWLAKHL
jgi:alpha-beta hydrolase superfamily lysophospholipase